MNARHFFPAIFAAALIFLQCQNASQNIENEANRLSKAGESLRMWHLARTFPDGTFHTENYLQAMQQIRLDAQLRGGNSGNDWQALGPKNIGGRTLCLAFHPSDTNIIYAGSASGGLWKTMTAGRGYSAWQRVETGFPVLGVSAIAINPLNPNELYIGTGEVYNLENSMPNVATRTTRGTYGIGILKTTDGGLTWKHCLDWSYEELTGVQDIKINPLRPATVFAATTEGFFRSWDSGAHWHKTNPREMAVDIEIHPADTSRIFTTHGSLDDNGVSGIFRSTDGGSTFTKLAGGLPASFSGKTLLSVCQSQPDIVYASVADAFAQNGLFKSTNGGDTWTKISTQNVATYQGWYSHDISARPDNPDEAVWGGIDVYKSTNGGQNWAKKTSWNAWVFGQVPVGGPEGPGNYVHADIHRIYHHPDHPNRVFCATDGGIFVSHNAGDTWEGRNGSYQTTQFYANLGNSATDPSLCIGGMQDNSTAIFIGDDAWVRVLGGDGECAAIDPSNDQTMYGSSQYLNISKSTNGGANFFNISPPDGSDPQPCFNGPFELAPSNPKKIYAGGSRLWVSPDGGTTWDDPHANLVNDGNGILTIAVCPTDENLIFFSTAPTQTPDIQMFKSEDGGETLEPISANLPNRMCMDIAFDPADKNILYAVFSGFDQNQVWKTEDGGQSWAAVSDGLPALPTNTVLVDPEIPNHVYIGNDLGVWLSRNGGDSWENYALNAPPGMLAMHLSISANRQLRVATHGLGVWQTPMATEAISTEQPDFQALARMSVSPNPTSGDAVLKIALPEKAEARLRFYDFSGKEISLPGLSRKTEKFLPGESTFNLDLKNLPPGTYGVVLEGKIGSNRKPFRKTLTFFKI